MRRRLTVCLAMFVLAAMGCSDTTPMVQAGDARKDRPPVVVVLGDSYSAGTADIPPESTWAAEVARTLHWQVVIAGHSGTGFVSPGRIGKSFRALFDEQLSWRPDPDMVVVAGGHNDWPYPPAMVGVAAEQLLGDIKRLWPETQIVLLGPLWGGDPRPEVLPVRDALKGVARRLEIPFIDPLRQQWITGDREYGTGNAAEYILPDRTHPTPEGSRYIATRFVASLRELRLAEPPGDAD